MVPQRLHSLAAFVLAYGWVRRTFGAAGLLVDKPPRFITDPTIPDPYQGALEDIEYVQLIIFRAEDIVFFIFYFNALVSVLGCVCIFPPTFLKRFSLGRCLLRRCLFFVFARRIRHPPPQVLSDSGCYGFW